MRHPVAITGSLYLVTHRTIFVPTCGAPAEQALHTTHTDYAQVGPPHDCEPLTFL